MKGPISMLSEKPFAIALSLLLSVMSSGCAAGAQSAESTAALESTQVKWTPVLMRTSVSPRPFQGSDDKYNLVYELLLSNANKYPTEIKSIDVVDADTGKTIEHLDGKEKLQPVFTQASAPKTTSIPSGGNATVWMNLFFDKQQDVPKHLVHQITFDTKSMFNGAPAHYEYKGAQCDVDTTAPVVVSPPLRGGKWVAIGGYCGVVGHRRTLLPVENKLTSAQRYAIDWCRLDEGNYTTNGDKYANTSSPAYGQAIYAVADGTVVTVLDHFDEQVPFKPTGTDRYSHPAGNCIVEDIGNGLYGMYAHLKPGSLKVKAGDKVKRGDIIALLGNSGNSTGPHLHFHVTDSPSILGSNGVPYVFDNFEIVGEVDNLEQFFKNDAQARPQTIASSKYAGKHQQELPREGHIMQF